MKEIKVKVPEGITEFSVNINGETATVVYETKTEETGKKEEWQPQDGDFIAFGINEREPMIAIFKCKESDDTFSAHIILGPHDVLITLHSGWLKNHMRPATKAEKRRLDDALTKTGKRWNADKKCVEDLPRWRANYGEHYYYVKYSCCVIRDIEVHGIGDDKCYECGNYFKTEEAAERVANQIREIFKNSKAE